MKFLIIGRMKDLFVWLPVEQKKQVMDGMTAFIAGCKKAGTCKEIYNISSIKGSMSIWEVESAEKAASLFLENPAYPFQEFEMFILSDFDIQQREQRNAFDKQFVGR
jgi:hypothetical protein